jgi:hypothetical protein
MMRAVKRQLRAGVASIATRSNGDLAPRLAPNRKSGLVGNPSGFAIKVPKRLRQGLAAYRTVARIKHIRTSGHLGGRES